MPLHSCATRQLRINSYWIQCLLAIFSVLTLILYLTTISSQIDPYRYLDTTRSIYQKLNLNDAIAIEEVSEIWPWLETIISDIGGQTAHEINSLCSYNNPNQQSVIINNKNITLVDPTTPSYPCPYDVSLFNKERMISLSGNNQLLTFVMYFSRTNSHSTGKEDGETDSRTIKGNTHSPNPKRDQYYLEILTVSWGECILTDGKYHTLGSTLQWISRRVESHLAFEPMSYAYLNNTLIYPCYTYYKDNENYVLTSGNPNHPDLDEIIEAEHDRSNKRIIWVVKALDYYIRCLDVMSSAKPIMAYLTSLYKKSSYYELDHLAKCTELLSTPPQNLTHHYISDSEFHDNKYSQKEFGTFLSCKSELDWVISAHVELTREYLMDGLNIFTRTIDIYALTRNLGDEALFYALTTISFSFDVNGGIKVMNNINYSPIIQFTYGTSRTTPSDAGSEGTGYVPNQHFLKTYVLEVVSIILLGCFIMVTCHTLCDKVYTVYTTLRAVAPVKSSQEHISGDDPKSGLEMVSSIKFKNGNQSSILQQEGEIETSNQAKVVPFSSDWDIENRNPSVTILGEENVEPDDKTPPTNIHQEQQSITHSIRYHRYYLTFLTIIDPFTAYDILNILTILCMMMCIIYRVSYINKSFLIHDILIRLNIENGDYDSELENIVHLLLSLGSLEIVYVNIVAITISILLIQFFRYISFDERLAMISLTVYESLSLLIPVLLVFVIVLGSYAIIGQAIYGKLLQEFSTTNHAINTLFLFLLGDTTAYYLMNPIATTGTPFYFWSYIIIVYFILFNMVLAIIMFVYESNTSRLHEKAKSA